MNATRELAGREGRTARRPPVDICFHRCAQPDAIKLDGSRPGVAVVVTLGSGSTTGGTQTWNSWPV